MKISKYWARESAEAEDKSGYKYHLISWSGSDKSLTEAKQKAIEKIKLWKGLLQKGQFLRDYPYEDKDTIREELVQEFYDNENNLIAAITRNRYGALVLNSAKVFFADIDLPTNIETSQNPFSKLFAMFGIGKKPAENNQNPRLEFRQRFAEFHHQNPELSLRIYETAAGFRLVILNKLFDPLSEETQLLLKQLNSDELYIRLCRSQACFRARLTPKPWRCDLKKPPNSFPRGDKNEERRFLSWLESYERASKEYGVCHVVEELGSAVIAKPVQAVLQVHDKYVLNHAHKTLA